MLSSVSPIELAPIIPKETIRYERHGEHERYYLADGKQVAGASTVAKLGDDPNGLIFWSWSLGMKGQDYKTVRGAYADTGSIVHFLCSCYLGNVYPDLREFDDDEVFLARPGFEKFLRFWEKENLVMVEQEAPMVHEELKYGGKLDLVASDSDGRLVLIDFKSSKKLYFGHRMQLAGYEMLWNYNREEQIARRAIIRIGRDLTDTFHAHWIPDERSELCKTVFRCQAALYQAINAEKYSGKRITKNEPRRTSGEKSLL